MGKDKLKSGVGVIKIDKKPIDVAYERIAELKAILHQQNIVQEKLLNMIKEINVSLKDLKDFKEKEVIEKEKLRQGWFY
tara:strand:- start:328 stop:564 length:237 start_codon:yes stop_codon:yes gene_type:complete